MIFLFLRPLLCLKSTGLHVLRTTAVMLIVANGLSFAAKAHSYAVITLDQAIKKTLTNNPQLHEFYYREQVLVGESKTAKLTPGYSVDAEVENFLGTGDLSGTQEAEFSLSLSSVIELGDKIHARSQYIGAKQQQLSVEKQLLSLDVLAEVTRRYIDVLAQQETLKVLIEAQQLAEDALQAVTKRVSAGASPLFEQRRAQATLAEATLNTTSAKQQLHTYIKSLAIMWGEQQPSFNKVEGNLFLLKESPKFSELTDRLDNSPHLQLFAEQSRLQAAELRITQAANKPDISWSAGIRHINGMDETALVAGVSIPLLSQSRNAGAYESQRARTEQIEPQKQASLRSLYHQLNQTLDARNRALLEVASFQKGIIPPLKEALSLVEKAYSNGRFSYLEWVTTRQELVEAQYALIAAAKQAHQRAADLEALTGISLVTNPPASTDLSAPIFNEKQ